MKLLALAVVAAPLMAAEPLPLLHPLFADHMVFPRDRPAPVWGWSAPGAKLRVSLAGASAETVAGADGRWQATLGPLQAGGPYELVLDGPQQVVRSDVLIGDVWLFSGQSNMEFGLGGAEGGGGEIARSASVESVRLLHVGRRMAAGPLPVHRGPAPVWCRPAPGNVGGFSAVAWFTGKTLNQELNVPIGLVSCAWSGSNIRGWMTEGAISSLGLYGDELAALRPLAKIEIGGGPTVADQEQAVVDAWWTGNDPGTAGGWQRPEQDDGAAPWRALVVPGRWSEPAAPVDGVAWIRRTVELPAAAAGLPARLALGGISDEEVTWINGVQVGTTRGWNQPHSHEVPTGVLRAGRNAIAIRVWSAGGRGSALGAPGDWHLDVRGSVQPIPLAGEWRLATSVAGPAVAALPTRPGLRFQGGNGSSTLLFNGGIAPLTPFAFTGAVWYQGEQDAGNPDYARLLPAMIADWRSAFAAPQLSFVVVQLPAFHERTAEPVQPQVWFGAVREAQLATARTVPGVGLAVTTDLGDAANVHPTRKREVGERAAHAALAVAYGREDGGGPLFDGATRAGDAMRVRFTRVHGALALRTGEPSGFALCGADGVWKHATATVDRAAVLVRSPLVPAPVAVRYGWAENPPVTLYDGAGMPASPFRSDKP